MFLEKAVNYETDGLNGAKISTTSRVRTDTNFLHSNWIRTNESSGLPALHKVVFREVHSLKGGKSPDVDNTPANILKQLETVKVHPCSSPDVRIWSVADS